MTEVPLVAHTGSDVAVRAPGRANLIGEHTDYNDGFVLPVALELETTLLGRRQEGRVRLTSRDAEGVTEVDLATGVGPTSGWGAYVTAVVGQLLASGFPLRGVDGVLTTTIPVGTGLSSSAALEVAVALALLDERLPEIELARLCQRAENDGVGVPTGLMDQLASVCGVAGSALFIDCRAASVTPVPLPPGVAVLVIDSAVSRTLATSAYDERRASCERAAKAFGVPALRDLDLATLEAGRGRLDGVTFLRARHVVTENARVLAAVAALRARDHDDLGRLFAESHASMASDFAITTPEIDELVSLAGSTPGVLASRMTGGGFGGCTVSLVSADRATAAGQEIVSRYRAATGLAARFWVSAAAGGATSSAGRSGTELP